MEIFNDIINEWRGIRPDCDECLSNHTCDYLNRLIDRLDAAYKRDIQTMVDAGVEDMQMAMDEATKLREENERLKAALKPVLEVRWEERKYNYCSGTVPTKDLVLVVRDAQRIYNGGAK